MTDDLLDGFTVDPDSQIGVSAQIRDFIALAVADGLLAPGDRLPPSREVANRLGVNLNTLRAAYTELEGEGLLETRHGVGTTVTDVGPDQLAAVTWRGRSNSIGVLIAGLDVFYTPMLRAIEETVSRQGTLVAIVDGRDSPRHASHALRQLVARGVDGLIAVSVGELPHGHGARRDRLPPIVYVDQPDRSGHVIGFDTAQAGELATRHLLAEGRRRIALVTVPDDIANLAGLRAGYERALADACPASSARIVHVDGFLTDSARPAVTALLDADDPPDAIITSSAVQALVALAEASARGVDVPRDLAILGYGDAEPAQLAHPQLSMIELPVREAGTLAARALQDLIAKRPHEPQRHTLPGNLIIRDSCGPHT